jgi:hypothetical protein
VLADVKVNPSKISLTHLKGKSKNLIALLPDFEVEYSGLSIEDM